MLQQEQFLNIKYQPKKIQKFRLIIFSYLSIYTLGQEYGPEKRHLGNSSDLDIYFVNLNYLNIVVMNTYDAS